MPFEKFSTAQMFGYRKGRIVKGENRKLSREEEIYQAIYRMFNFHCTSILPFEIIYENLINDHAEIWCGGSRKKLKYFIEFYDESFSFTNGSLTHVYYTGNPFVAKYNYPDFVAKQKEKETLEEDKRNKIDGKYDFVLEYDALNCILSIFCQSGREKLHFGFIKDILMTKFKSSNDYTDLKIYIGEESMAKSFMTSRSYMFLNETGDYFSLRPEFYTETVYKLNEFLREEENCTWKSLNSLMEFYFNNISQKYHSEMQLTTRESFLSFLNLHNFVFNVRLEEDYEIKSNIPIPRVNWDTVRANDSFLCDNFIPLLKDNEEKRKKILEPGISSNEDEHDEYFMFDFNPSNGIYEEKSDGENLKLNA